MRQGETVVEPRPAILSSLVDIVSAGGTSMSGLMSDLLRGCIDDRDGCRKAAETKSDAETGHFSFEEAMVRLVRNGSFFCTD